VVPTLGRSTLDTLLAALASAVHGQPVELILVDDRPPGAGTAPLPAPPGPLATVTKTVPGRAAGPAAARNDGWRAPRYPWVSFLDDDVVPTPTWFADLARDLAVPDRVAGPRTVAEVSRMVTTSVVIPPLAIAYWLAGWWRHRDTNPTPGRFEAR
jgi:hypothetical protein